MTRETVKAFVVICGNTLNSHKPFLDHLSRSPNFHKVTSVEDSNVIVAFGTDIQAALRKIQAISATQPVVLVVLHHRAEQNPVVPNSSQSVDRSDVFTVDCLFNEDRGLLSCQHNDEALKAVKEHLGLEDGHPHRKSWPCQLLFWTLALLTIILISCLGTSDYIHAVWFIPWMLLLLVVLLERCGYGKWNLLIIVIVNVVVVLVFSLIQRTKKAKVTHLLERLIFSDERK